jgi:5-methylthioadenosine/S-adenosylhomocysteine deaminase
LNEIDLLVKDAEYLISMDSDRRMIRDGALAVTGDTIIDIGTTAELDSRYKAKKTISARGKFLFPGFITTHTHLFQTLLKGLGRDRPLIQWLDSSVRIALRNYNDECMYWGAMTGLTEALRTGTTTVTDSQYCQSRKGLDRPVLNAYEDLGIRGVLSKSHTDVSGFAPEIACEWVETEEDYIRDTDALCSEYQNHPTISMSIAPGIIWNISKEGSRLTREIADKWKIPITMHLVETEDDDEYTRSVHGMSTIDFLEETGLLGPDFVAVHAVHVTDHDIKRFKKYGVHISHCPLSNMILASGTAPVHRYLAEGINVSLAADGAASNDTQDMLEVMKVTALLHKVVTRDASVVSAADVLEMATLGGARALLKEKEIGSLEKGKKADFFIYNPMNARSVPVHDPVSTLVYSSAQPNVETTVVGGRILLEDGKLLAADETHILRETQRVASSLVERSGLGNLQWGRRIEVGEGVLYGNRV